MVEVVLRTDADAAELPSLLAEVGSGRQQLVVQVPDGTRLVVLPEDELARLRRAAAVRSAAADGARGARGGEDALAAAGAVPLSAREKEVLGLVAGGMVGSGVASHLGLALNTVAQHLVSARRKLGVRSTVQAVEAARALGELPPADDDPGER